MGSNLAIHGGTPIRNRPWPTWPEFGEPEKEALLRVLKSGSWGGFPSPNTEAQSFSLAFSSYIGSQFAVPCVNGTYSLILALQAARISPGAEVITSVYTFVATAAAIAMTGAVPILVDICPNTYCIDPELVQAAITPRTEAILPVHLASCMADMERLNQIAEKHNLLVIEDCAHAHGLGWRDKSAGAIGHLGSFSMQSSKLLTAGEGGVVTTSDPVFAQRLQSLVNCGRKETGYDQFPEQMLGHNLRLTEWQAAILGEQLKRLPDQHFRRQANLALFERALSESIPDLRPLVRDGRQSGTLGYQFILRHNLNAFSGASRDQVIAALRAEGIPCSGYNYLPLNQEPLFAADPLTNPLARQNIDYRMGQFPVAHKAAFNEAIWLPHQTFLGDSADVDDLISAFLKVQSAAKCSSLPDPPPQQERE